MGWTEAKHKKSKLKPWPGPPSGPEKVGFMPWSLVILLSFELRPA